MPRFRIKKGRAVELPGAGMLILGDPARDEGVANASTYTDDLVAAGILEVVDPAAVPPPAPPRSVPVSVVVDETESAGQVVATDGAGGFALTTLSPGANRVVQAGNMGATPTLAMAASDEAVSYVGKLTANATLTITGLAAGQSVRLLLTQDATGGRTLSITAAGSTASVPVNSTANAASVVTGYYDGTDLYVRGAV